MTTVRVTSSLNPSMDSSFAALEVFTSCPWFQKTNSNSPFLDFLVISQQIAPCFHNIFPMELYPCNILRVAWGLFLCVRVGGLFVLFVWFGSFFFFLYCIVNMLLEMLSFSSLKICFLLIWLHSQDLAPMPLGISL